VTGATRTADRRGARDGVPARAGTRPPEPGRDGPRRSRRVRRRRLLLLAAGLALGGFGGWVLLGSDWLRLESVSVDGTRVLTHEQVRGAAALPLGTPLASLDTGAAADRVRTELPRVAEVEVAREWPHGVRVKVTERKPELVMEKGGEYTEVDAGGVRFATVGERPKGVPLLLVEAGTASRGEEFGPAALRRAGAAVRTALPDSVRGHVRTVRVASYDAVTVELSDGRTVLWGSAERGSAKAKSLTALLKAVPDARHFDVSVPSAPAASGS
jgi:cell division protein FtsQ